VADLGRKNSWFSPRGWVATKEGEAFSATKWHCTWQEAAGSWQQEVGGFMIRSFKELLVYQKAFEQAMKIFEVTKSFPKAEQYSLTDQARRSSRSVCTNIGEAWRKRRYPDLARFFIRMWLRGFSSSYPVLRPVRANRKDARRHDFCTREVLL